jgi:hypothetical protein
MTNTLAEKIPEDLRPKLIVWDLTSEIENDVDGPLPLNQHECLLVLDSIARISKPIIVIKGPSVIHRDDINEIIDYGCALDLKMVIELQPEELTNKIIDGYRNYGVRIFRIILDGRIIEDIGTRFQQSPEFLALERAVGLLQDNGFELHFSVTLENLNRRSLSYYLDYAFLKRAKGLYCHLGFRENASDKIRTIRYLTSVDELLLYISDMKEKVPSNMYLSPQCVRYTICADDECGRMKLNAENTPHWIPTCLAGRTFGYLDAYGQLYPCQRSGIAAGDLRSNGYDFKSLWFSSKMLTEIRLQCRSCTETRLYLEEIKLHKKFKQLVVQENIRNIQ